MNNQEIISLGGTLEPTPETKFWVSGWHIPGGCDYSRAKPVNGFFEDGQVAMQLEFKYVNPPEMASCAVFDDEHKALWAHYKNTDAQVVAI